MAKINEMNQPQWDQWVESRPPVVRDLCRRLPPDRLYRMKSTGQRVTIISYAEEGKVRVLVSGKYNFVCQEREVFGVDPDDMEECDLPAKNEPLGSLDLSVDEVKELLRKPK